jgi:exodeoxyribonuclease VII small subunit
MATKKATPSALEPTLQELEIIVNSMEQGNLTLEQSLEYFEKGVGLAKQCQKTLTTAEQKIKILSGTSKLEDYHNEEG